MPNELDALIAWLRKRAEPNSGIRYVLRGFDDNPEVILHGTDATFIKDHFHGKGAAALADAIAALHEREGPEIKGLVTVARQQAVAYDHLLMNPHYLPTREQIRAAAARIDELASALQQAIAELYELESECETHAANLLRVTAKAEFDGLQADEARAALHDTSMLAQNFVDGYREPGWADAAAEEQLRGSLERARRVLAGVKSTLYSRLDEAEDRAETAEAQVQRLTQERDEARADKALLRAVADHAREMQEDRCSHEGYSFDTHGRCCPHCGMVMMDWGD